MPTLSIKIRPMGYPGGDGVKTGYTRQQEGAYIHCPEGGYEVDSCKLNAPDWFKDNYALLDYGFENYKPYHL